MKAFKLFGLVLVVLCVLAAPALAADAPAGSVADKHGTFVLTGVGFGAALGAALTIIGAGYGFSKIGAAALESMARQPEVAGKVQIAMIIIAALLEGATFFALLVCYSLLEKVQGL